MKHIGKRKTVLLCQGDVQAVIGGSCLQFKIEAAAKALAQRQAPCFVHTPAERSMNDELHAPAFVEKALGDNRVLSRHSAKHSASLQDVFDHLLGSGVVEA